MLRSLLSQLDGGLLGGGQPAEVAEAQHTGASLFEAPLETMAPAGALGERNEGYSPGTPVASPEVKIEFTWPEAAWDEGVIDLDDQHDLLSEWRDGSEEESSDLWTGQTLQSLVRTSSLLLPLCRDGSSM